MTQEFLEVSNISRRFGKVNALEKVSFTANRGEVICLAGQSGCGKSSLLRAIAGIERPDNGHIIINGQEMSGPNCFIEPEMRGIGFMFQDYALFPHQTVTDNILFGLKRVDKSIARQRCKKLIERLGLSKLVDRFPHMLSGGEQQRVALARALAPEPDILLMDEPFSNLDRGLRDDIRLETIALLRELGTTIIMVTHDPEEALSSGDRVILMRNGKIIQAGSGEDLYQHPNSVYAAEFFCSFNKVQAIFSNGFLNTPLGHYKADGFNHGDKATAYIRPQAIFLSPDGKGIEANIISSTLMGEIEQVILKVENIDVPLRMRSTHHKKLKAGNKVHIRINSDDVFVF
ncbi:ABC transporter ATP-binding protein [Bartonella sp. HY038]|uniref:ABC transporter ATP-binding protein n=1 Tax=Bartonella sp. HY038 TaxID=2759660 RepID=UPI0015FE5283|nr:ABC transporter ATP-binding protein [Bartonella sp. HY038]